MESLRKTMKSMEGDGFKTRKLNPLSFGTLEQCRVILMSALSMVDKTNEIKWLPEYEKVCEWMVDTKGKGLILTGDCGRGKSNIITGVIPLIWRAKFNKVVRPCHVDDLEMNLGSEINRWCYCIDEVGAENISNNYGAKFHPVVKLMDKAEAHMKLCFLSTNLNSLEIAEKYGDRTLDRIMRLCEPVRFQGESLRPQ